MSTTIWKARIRPNAKHGTTWRIDIPARVGAKALFVGVQDGEPTIWFEVDPDKLDAMMTCYSVGTGCGEIPKDCRYVGSMIDGEYVWHIYAEF